MKDEIILVDTNDREVGFGEKMEVHRKAQLHRAFSIFVVNKQNELLLQRRALTKYHSGGLWANTCCSHPIRNENQEVTVHRRLREEMGFDCELKPIFSFIYKVTLQNGLTEYEFDHVYLGHYEGSPTPNPLEVDSWKWMPILDVKKDIQENPDAYVFWIKPAMDRFFDYFNVQEHAGASL